MATLSTLGQVGIDEEDIKPRSSAFLRQWFTETERELCQDSSVRQTLIWCMKEAVSKALGVGLALSTKDIEVRTIHPKTCVIQLHNDALSLSGHNEIQTYWYHQDNRIVALAHLKSNFHKNAS